MKIIFIACLILGFPLTLYAAELDADQIYSLNVSIRIGAAQDLIQGWRNEPNIVLDLIEFATQNRDNANGVYNTVVVLNEFPLRALQVHKQEVLNFLEIAKNTGSKTEAKAMTLG